MPDHLNAVQLLISAAGSFQRCLQTLGVRAEDGDRHMNVRGAQRGFPQVRATVSHVA